MREAIFLQLPLPYLKVGYLTAPPAGTPIAPHGDWRRSEFVLNHEGLKQVRFFFFFELLNRPDYYAFAYAVCNAAVLFSIP